VVVHRLASYISKTSDTLYAGVREKAEGQTGQEIFREAAWRTVKAQVSVNEQVAVSAVWREALAIIRRYPLATLVPAVVLGALVEATYFVEDWRPVWEQLLASLTAAFAFYLYIAYVEEIAAEAERGAERITIRGVLRKLRQATPVVPSVMVASVVAITVVIIATGLLVLPGLWVLTRWSLFAPVIRKERLGPMAALKRSNELVRGHFWLVVGTATLAFILEQVVVGAGAEVGHLVSGSETWSEWLGGSIAASLITPLAALTTSVAYSRLAAPLKPVERENR
jgi:hypothetical protein